MSCRLLTGGIAWAGTACTPRAAWVLVDGDRIAAVGDEGGPGAASPPAADRRIDITGSHVLPGFVDVHLHLSQAAWFPLGADALGWQSLADALRAVRVQADVDPVAPWVLFWRVAQWGWPEGRLPTAAELDRAAPGRRVLVSTLNMHRGALSPAGLAAIGLAGAGAARLGGDVTCDRRGRPTGEVWEAAYSLALQRALSDIATQTGEAGAQGVFQAEAARLLGHGITHAHDPYVAPDWHQQMLTLRAQGPLRLSWATGAGRDGSPAAGSGVRAGRPVRRLGARGEGVRRRRRSLRAAVAQAGSRRAARQLGW